MISPGLVFWLVELMLPLLFLLWKQSGKTPLKKDLPISISEVLQVIAELVIYILVEE